MLCKSCDGFQLASKIITRLAAVKFIPNPPALVDIKNNLALMLVGLLKMLHIFVRTSIGTLPSSLK